MVYELIIGFTAFLYLIWKYVLSGKEKELTLSTEGKINVELSGTEGLTQHDKVKEEESTVLYTQTINDVSEIGINYLPELRLESNVGNELSSNKFNRDLSYCESIDHKELTLPYNILRQDETVSVSINANKPHEIKDLITKCELIKKAEQKPPLEKRENVLSQNIKNIESDLLITPSQILKQQRNKYNVEFNGKRDSPPRERLTEFLEKTILCDDKIQSIIQNLSLDKTDAPKSKESDVVLNETFLCSEEKPTLGISERAVKLQNSIDEIANSFKAFKDGNIINEGVPTESERPYKEVAVAKRLNAGDINEISEVKQISEENNPLLKRLQKQSGFPGGLNFGSVIGELKNKTRNANGGLKPVFKKFDPDLEVDTQACPFFISHIHKIGLRFINVHSCNYTIYSYYRCGC